MDPVVMEWTQLAFRWSHAVAGIIWIGHLYFFNWVNAHLAKTYDAESKKKVVPELMPRALYWFRWGAAWTWLTGFLLAGLVYYMDKLGMARQGGLGHGAVSAISLILIVVIFFLYDALWKALGANELVGAVVSFLGLTGLFAILAQFMVGRALFIHLGMLLGTIMAMNVWMRIWPAQRKIIAAIKAGNAPDAALVALAGLRSKHNTYMSVPLVFSMVSNHYPGLYGSELNWLILSGLVGLGWLVTKGLYLKSGSAATTRIE